MVSSIIPDPRVPASVHPRLAHRQVGIRFPVLDWAIGGLQAFVILFFLFPTLAVYAQIPADEDADTIASKFDAYADLLAERIAVLGGVVRGTVRMATMQSILLEYPGDLVVGDAHMRALAERLAPYTTALLADITHAADVEDAATAALYSDIARRVEKPLWGFDAYLAC